MYVHVRYLCMPLFYSPDSDSYRGSYTSNRGEADEPLWRIGRGTRVPLQGAFVVCYGWGAKGDDQFWWSGRGAIAGCHCGVLWLGGGG